VALTPLNPNICAHIFDTNNIEPSDYRTFGLSSSPPPNFLRQPIVRCLCAWTSTKDCLDRARPGWRQLRSDYRRPFVLPSFSIHPSRAASRARARRRFFVPADERLFTFSSISVGTKWKNERNVRWLRGWEEEMKSRRWRWLQSVMCWPSRPRTQLAN